MHIILVIITNTDYKIVHTQTKDYRKDCFSSSVSVWLSHHCEMWLSLIRKVQHLPFVFVRMRHEWGILASKCHRNMITRWYVKQQRRYCRPRGCEITKIFFFLRSNHCYANLKFYKKSKGWLPKNRQKRQIALRGSPFRCRVALWSDTKRDVWQKNNVILHKKSDWSVQSSQKWNNSTSLDSSPV